MRKLDEDSILTEAEHMELPMKNI